jgi:hypothetical protein
MAIDNHNEVASNWGEDGFLDSFNRGPDDKKADKYDVKIAKGNPDASIYSYDEDEQRVKSEKFKSMTVEEQQKKNEDVKTYNKLVVELGGDYSPEILEKASAKYFDSAAQENPADIKDPKQRAIAEEQNRQVEKVCKVLGEVSDGGSKNDVLKNVFFEYVKDAELSRGIAEMEKTLSPYGSASTASEKTDKDNQKDPVDLNLLRGQAMRESKAEEGGKMYKIPAAGNAESAEMTHEGMTKYSAMLKAKVDEMNQGNKEKAELESLDKKLAGRIEAGA